MLTLALALAASILGDVDVCPPRAAPLSWASRELPRTRNGVLVLGGRGILMFGAGQRSASAFAAAVGRWQDRVVAPIAARSPSTSPTLSVVIAPTGAHLYLPERLRGPATAELDNLASIRAALRPGIRFADVVAAMDGHADEPLFLKGDHHWNGRGAYYAYRAWALAHDLTPLPLHALSRHEVPTGAGSLHRMTGAPELVAADRAIEVWLPPLSSPSVQVMGGERQDRPRPGRLFDERIHAYGTFLQGDEPLLVLRGGTSGDGRTALVVKNSYGNAFAALLLAHFETVVVVDYRYLRRPIADVVARFGITDVVIVTQSILANAAAHTARLNEVARGTTTAWATVAELRAKKAAEAVAAGAAAP